MTQLSMRRSTFRPGEDKAQGTGIKLFPGGVEGVARDLSSTSFYKRYAVLSVAF